MSDVMREDGLWWTPDSPEHPSTGALVIEGGRARLESVVGPLSAIQINPQVFLSGPPVIHGRSHKGTTYTCFRNYYSGFNESWIPTGGHTVAKLDVIAVLRGQHIAAEAAAIFRQAVFQYSNLHIWLHQLDPFAVQEIPAEERSFEVRHNRGSLWEVNIGGGVVLQNDFSFSNSRSFDPAFWKVSHTDGVRFVSEQARPYVDFLTLEHRFRTLVNLLADCQLQLESKTFRSEPNGPSAVQLLGRDFSGSFAQRQDPSRHSVPVGFASLPNFSTILGAWFAEYDRLEPIVNLYLFGKQNRHLDIGNMFLGVMQALEAYHRNYHPGAFMSQADYDANVRPVLNAAIPAEVQGPFRQRLRSAIQFGFEFSLRRRLSELAEALPESDVFERIRQNEFRNRTVETRNTMTHQIPHPESPPMAGGELYTAIQRWREALFALILGRIGVPSGVIVRAARQLQNSAGTFVNL